MKLTIDIPDGMYDEICSAKFPLEDGYRLVAAIKDGIRVSTTKITIPKVSEISIGYQIKFTVDAKIYTATAVKEESNGGMLFVFDNIVGESSITLMQSFLDKFYQKLPENLKVRMGGNNLRLLDASEVFYKNVPEEWKWLTENTRVQVENPPIPYFARQDFRVCDANWWLRSVAAPSRFVFVNYHGYAGYPLDLFAYGVRPAFTIY